MNIDINTNENRIYLYSTEKLENFRINIYDWNPYNSEEIVIYSILNSIDENVNYWHAPEVIMKDKFGIIVKIFQNDILLKEEKFRLKTKYGKTIKDQALVIRASGGMGDNLICTPIIRKLYQIYNRKITLYTYYPEVFINNQYLENIIKIDINQDINNLNIDQNKYEIHNIWHTYKLPFDIVNRNTNFDTNSTTGWLASQIGLSLNIEDDLLIDFFPNDYIPIKNLPNKYIVINPNITTPARTWGSKNWNKLIKLLENDISIVALGKTSSIRPEKTYLNDIVINNGVNLIGHEAQNTLSQAYHIINNSVGIVTHNTGLYCLALSTNVNIHELGTHIKPYYFRNKNNKKHYYIVGNCNLNCMNDLYNYVSEHGTINCLMPGYKCLLDKSTYECHPTPEQVYESILKTIKN